MTFPAENQQNIVSSEQPGPETLYEAIAHRTTVSGAVILNRK